MFHLCTQDNTPPPHPFPTLRLSTTPLAVDLLKYLDGIYKTNTILVVSAALGVRGKNILGKLSQVA